MAGRVIPANPGICWAQSTVYHQVGQWYTLHMPTTLGRIQVTQTPPVERALAVAAEEWPDVPRAEQITRLLTAGAESVQASRAERAVARRAMLNETRGSLRSAYPTDYLDDLRRDWAE